MVMDTSGWWWARSNGCETRTVLVVGGWVDGAALTSRALLQLVVDNDDVEHLDT